MPKKAKANKVKPENGKPELRYEIPERFLANTEPIHLFEVDGNPVSVRLLSANRGVEWEKAAYDVDLMNDDVAFIGGLMEKAIKSRNEAADEKSAKQHDENVKKHSGAIRAKQAEKYERIVGLLKEYDAAVFCEDLFDSATAAQILSAYQTLKGYTGPLVVGSALRAESLMELRATLSSTETKD